MKFNMRTAFHPFCASSIESHISWLAHLPICCKCNFVTLWSFVHILPSFSVPIVLAHNERIIICSLHSMLVSVLHFDTRGKRSWRFSFLCVLRAFFTVTIIERSQNKRLSKSVKVPGYDFILRVQKTKTEKKTLPLLNGFRTFSHHSLLCWYSLSECLGGRITPCLLSSLLAVPLIFLCTYTFVAELRSLLGEMTTQIKYHFSIWTFFYVYTIYT